MKKNKIKNIAEFLLDSGLLFEINRNVLHPFGLALEVIIDDEDKITFGNIWDCRDDPEGLVYDDDAFVVGKNKFEKFMKEFGEARLSSRKRRLGFIVQETQMPSIHDTSLDLSLHLNLHDDKRDTDPENLNIVEEK
jgi:hypothetical protein